MVGFTDLDGFGTGWKAWATNLIIVRWIFGPRLTVGVILASKLPAREQP